MEPDFDALRKKRNDAVAARLEKFAAEHGVPVSEIVTTHNPQACYCACGTGGPCEHKWDGEPWESEDGCCWSTTCSRCGMTAMSHGMRVGD